MIFIRKMHVWRCLLPILGLLLMVSLLAACTTTIPDGPRPGISDTEAATPTEGTPAATNPGDETLSETLASGTDSPDTVEPGTDAPVVTETDTTEPAPELWKPDMGIFNEGKVEYEKLVETTVYAMYPDDKLGQSMKPGDTGVVTVISSDFSDNDVSIGGSAAPRDPNATQAVDGKMYMPYDANSADHLAGNGWTTWAPTVFASLTTYKQSAFAVTWDVRSVGNGAWLTAMIGCYLTKPDYKIPDGAGDGLWLSYQEAAGAIVVYHPDNTCWPGGWSTIPVAKGLLSGMFETTVVCSPDRTTYVYITPENSTEEHLVAKITFTDGKIRTYSEDGTMIDEAACTTNALKGEGYSFFVHGGGAAVIDEVALMGAATGKVEEKVTVTATPTAGNTLGLDITNKTDLVSICYSVWFDAILGSGTEKVEYWNNITEALANRQPWGGVTAFHYWAKPALGYYRSSDKDVIRTHMTQLYAAGVDFIVIDLTNAGDGYIGSSAWTSYIETPMNAICDTIMEMRAEGKGTPYVVYWVGDGEGPLYKELYDKYYNVEKWKDCFVYWDGKPFMLTTHKQPADFPYADIMTVRSMWGLRGTGYAEGQWSFLNTDNRVHIAKDKDGNAEQVSVAVASQETYMSQPSAHGREGGFFWFTQWYHAFDVRPKIVTLTWWNEWTAQRFEVPGLQGPQFVDNYNQDYSRDIEPMEGGHGDQYYKWLIEYIGAYKGGLDCPILVEDKYMIKVDRWLSKLED